MRAAWYDRNGVAREVLIVGELLDPEPGPGEVRVRPVTAGVNPADVKRRLGVGGRTMTAPRVILGDDGFRSCGAASLPTHRDLDTLGR